ncbi:MAG: hypothetical protein WAU60_14245 [Candidatus Competibacter denitrificans]
MALKSSISLLITALLLSPIAFAEDVNSAPMLIALGRGQWMTPREEFMELGIDLDAGQQDGKLLTDRFDLNDDGVPEYFLRTVCGNGGCAYPLFDGRTYAYLGSVFGSEVWWLQRRSKGLPIIEGYGHLGAMLGVISRYEFNGSRYEQVSSRQIGDEETQELYKRLAATPRIKAP